MTGAQQLDRLETSPGIMNNGEHSSAQTDRAMKVFLVNVNDENFYRLLPRKLGGTRPGDQRVKVMGFPPLAIETLAPVLRQHGHQVRMFDTCHPGMKETDIAQALREDPPDVAQALSLPRRRPCRR